MRNVLSVIVKNDRNAAKPAVTLEASRHNEISASVLLRRTEVNFEVVNAAKKGVLNVAATARWISAKSAAPNDDKNAALSHVKKDAPNAVMIAGLSNAKSAVPSVGRNAASRSVGRSAVMIAALNSAKTVAPSVAKSAA